jgi:hypothetical protein
MRMIAEGDCMRTKPMIMAILCLLLVQASALPVDASSARAMNTRHALPRRLALDAATRAILRYNHPTMLANAGVTAPWPTQTPSHT